MLLILVTLCVILTNSGVSADVCRSSACLEVADAVRQSLDPSVEPCSDFYHFACGGYLNKTVIPDGKAVIGRSFEMDDNISRLLKEELQSQSPNRHPPVFQKAKDIYHSCLNTEAIEVKGLGEMKERLKMYGGWPVLDAHWTDCSFDWTEAIGRIAKAGQTYDMILHIEVGFNEENVKQPVIKISEPEFGENVGISRDYLKKGLDDPVVQAYYKTMVDVAVAFGVDRAAADEQLMESLKFEMLLANISVSNEGIRSIETAGIKIPVVELQKRYSCVNWLSLFNSVLGEFVSVKEDNLVEFYAERFLKELGTLLQTTSKRVLANYIMWQVVFSSRTYLNQNIADISAKLLNVTEGTSSTEPRDEFCFTLTKQLLTPILAAAYVRKNFSPESKKSATELIEIFRKQLIKVIQESDWLDPITRKRALRKVELIKLSVGYPHELVDDSYLTKYYKRLKTSRADFFSNVVSVGRFNRYVLTTQLLGPYNVTAWDNIGVDSVISWNAHYYPNANIIAILAGLLHGYTYDVTRPAFLNIATAGKIICHEFTHSVDDQGANYDECGNLHDWWNVKTKEIFLQKAKAIGDEYSTYVVKEINMTLNGHIMQGEVIADHGGVKIAYMALEEILASLSKEPRLSGFENYSARQTFWLIQAVGACRKARLGILRWAATQSVHPPAEFRVNGPFRNSFQFAKDWSCPVGSYMNPEKKVNVW